MTEQKYNIGDCRELVKELGDRSIDCCITSPPYWSLRDYKTYPLIWDDNKECQHEWNDVVTEKEFHQTGANGRGSPNTTIHKSTIVSGFCSKCGAWKGSLGLEPSPELFINHLIDIFDLIKPKLKDEGNCFVNLGDTYWGGKGKSGYELPHEAELRKEKGETLQNFYNVPGTMDMRPNDGNHVVIKPKSLCMIPSRFAWNMIEHGWILRNEIIFYKTNHMPESVSDRLTKAHEVVYHFVKQPKYYYNLDAIREPLSASSIQRISQPNVMNQLGGSKQDELRGNPDNGNASRCNKMVQSLAKKYQGKFDGMTEQSEQYGSPRARTQRGYEYQGKWVDDQGYMNSLQQRLNNRRAEGYDHDTALNHPLGRNPGDVWKISLRPYNDAHFAVFPLELVKRPILAGCPPNGWVLDPFAGSGTVLEFCRFNNRNAIGFELNPDYAKLITDRAQLNQTQIRKLLVIP